MQPPCSRRDAYGCNVVEKLGTTIVAKLLKLVDSTMNAPDANRTYYWHTHQPIPACNFCKYKN